MVVGVLSVWLQGHVVMLKKKKKLQSTKSTKTVSAAQKPKPNPKPIGTKPITGQYNIALRPDVIDDYYGFTDAQKAGVIDTARKSRALLIVGPTGSGKTTLAMIIAKAITANPQNITDVNSVTQGGIDDVRKLIRLAEAVSLQGGRKVVIVDEAHKLSSNSVSAFLKPLEYKGQGGALYIFCTNQQQAMLDTFRKRCILIETPEWTPKKLRAFADKYAAIANVPKLTDAQLARCSCPRTVLTELQPNGTIRSRQPEIGEQQAYELVATLLMGHSEGAKHVPQVDFTLLMNMGKILRAMLGMPMSSDGPEGRKWAAKMQPYHGHKDGFTSADVARVMHGVGLALRDASLGNVPPIVLLDVLLAYCVTPNYVSSIIY